jgi:hypothetical protein
MFLYFLPFSRRERGGGTVGDHARRCRLRRSDRASFIAPWCNNRGGKAARLRMHGKKGTIKMILRINRLLVRCAQCVMGYGNCIQNGPHNCRGVCQSSGFEVKTRRIGLEPPKATTARGEATQRVASRWRTRCPIEGTRHP